MNNETRLDYLGKVLSWFFGILILLFLLSLAVPQMACSLRGNSTISKSLHNLKMIGLSLKIYAVDHNDEFPPGDAPEVVYRQLFPVYMTQNNTLIFPDEKARHVSTTNAFVFGQCGYTYISGSSEKSDPKTPLATERVQNPFTLSHTNKTLMEIFNGGGINVLYVDGSAHFQPIRNKNRTLQQLFTDAQIAEGKLRPRNPVTPYQNR